MAGLCRLSGVLWAACGGLAFVMVSTTWSVELEGLFWGHQVVLHVAQCLVVWCAASLLDLGRGSCS